MHGETNRGPITPEGKARFLAALKRAHEERQKLRQGEAPTGQTCYVPPTLPPNLNKAAKMRPISLVGNARK